MFKKWKALLLECKPFLGGALSFMKTRRYSIWEGGIHRWKIHDDEARTSQNVSMKGIDLKPKIALK